MGTVARFANRFFAAAGVTPEHTWCRMGFEEKVFGVLRAIATLLSRSVKGHVMLGMSLVMSGSTLLSFTSLYWSLRLNAVFPLWIVCLMLGTASICGLTALLLGGYIIHRGLHLRDFNRRAN